MIEAPNERASTARVTYVGHATVLLELDGVRLLTDPVLRSRVLHLRRLTAAPARFENVTAALVSHAHWDHLDIPSLSRLGRETQVIVPFGAGRLLRRRGFTDVVEVAVGDEVEIGGVAVTATPADHDARRGPLGVNAPALGYVIGGSKRVYFAGDTDLFDGMAELAPLDVALLPVAGWGPSLPPGHLDSVRAAEALRLLRPRLAIPIHWGTYAAMTSRRPGRAPDHPSPAAEFAHHATELAPDVDVRVLEPGETLELV